MTFEAFIQQAWSDHGKEPARVADRLMRGEAPLEKNEQIPALAGLATHVFGDHLGNWDEGIRFLENLRQHPGFAAGTESEKALGRSISALRLARGEEEVLGSGSLSDQIRVLAVAAGALSERKETERARKYFRQALKMAEAGLGKEDPANRSLAVTGNNLACALEENKERSAAETDLMVLAAEAARKFWEIAGGWNQVFWAEYRLVMTYLQAEEPQKALDHAGACLELARKNEAGAMELFYCYEALALVEKARKNGPGYAGALESANSEFGRLNAEEKSWCEESLKRL